jgi:alginate O-acetyltransferase complex protein AlgI
MLFNSYIFLLLFLPVVLALWWLPFLKTGHRLVMLTGASYLFYGWWEPRFVSLLIFSTVIDYLAGHKIHQSQQPWLKRLWLLVSVSINLGLLCFFKYFGFATESLNAINGWLYGGGSLPVWQIILPAGISFYTFQTMSYSIDIYRGQARPASSLWHFAAYVSLFPQLIAGPIVRYSELDEQLRSIPSRIPWDGFSRGIYFLVCGMVQKIMLADSIAAKIDPMLLDYQSLDFFASWFAMLGYTCQLYFDFAGYSNMAVGLGLMLGFEFPQNFNSPYKSKNIGEFWRRWHITLSSWLRDYLFIPLGGSKFGAAKTMRNLFIVMLLGGLWHGAGWTFVLWGAYHGLLLAGNRMAASIKWLKMPDAARIGITFVAVVFGWVIFRASDMQMCQNMMGAMVGLHGFQWNLVAGCGGVTSLGLLGFLMAVIFFAPNVWQIRFRPNLIWATGLAGVLFICVLRFANESPFLYFQF